MRVVLRASDVAAIIGMNKYKPRNEIFDDMWKKYSPSTFTGKTKKEKAEEILALSANARETMKSALEIKAKDSNQVQDVYSKVQETINLDSKLTDEQKVQVLDHIRSKVYTTHGTRSEDKTSLKVEVDEGVRLHKDNAFYTHEVCTLGKNTFFICGKIDRIEERPDGSRILIEIKNRTNRLFRRVVEYEMVQVQVYLQMLGLIHARLIEQYNNQVQSHDIDRDEEMWSNVILPGLENFCKELNEKFSES